jgi:hypothetical protein
LGVKVEIFKRLRESMELCFYSQNEDTEVDWKIKLIPLNGEKVEKEI